MALKFKTEKSITSGKSYVPSKFNVNSKNGLYEIQGYQATIDPNSSETRNYLNNNELDPFKQKTGYSATMTSDDIANRKLEDYKGHKYETIYEYGFNNDKKKPKEEKQKEKEPEPKKEEEPKERVKPKPVERAITPLPYNAAKSVSRTLHIMTKGNRIYPAKTYTKDQPEPSNYEFD